MAESFLLFFFFLLFTNCLSSADSLIITFCVLKPTAVITEAGKCIDKQDATL